MTSGLECLTSEYKIRNIFRIGMYVIATPIWSFQGRDRKLDRVWLKINIPKGNYWILRIGVVVICQKLGNILKNKVIQKLMVSKKWQKMFLIEGGKEVFRTCNVLPFSCTHLALWRGKGKGKDPRYMQNKKDSRISL